VTDLKKKGEPELFVLLFCFAGDWEVHRRYGREEKKETIPIYQPAGLHWPPVAWRVNLTRRRCSDDTMVVQHCSRAQKSC